MKKYKLYKLQPFNFDYKIVDISKEEYKRLKKNIKRVKKITLFYLQINYLDI